VRCICGEPDPPAGTSAFIACDTCEAWQHSVCLGEALEEAEQPDNYYCEQCAPEDHVETVQALGRGERIWETRHKIFQNEKKMGKSRKGAKKTTRPGWLKKQLSTEQTDSGAVSEARSEPPEPAPVESQEGSNKRKREDVKEEETKTEGEQPAQAQPERQDKRRKSAAPDVKTEVVDIDQLPEGRKKIAVALSKIITDEVNSRAKAGAYKMREGETAKSIGDRYASLIEY